MCDEATTNHPATQAEVEERLEAVLECERCADELERARTGHLEAIAKALGLPREKDGVPQSEKLVCGNYLIRVNGAFEFASTQLRIERIDHAKVTCIDTPNGQPAHAG